MGAFEAWCSTCLCLWATGIRDLWPEPGEIPIVRDLWPEPAETPIVGPRATASREIDESMRLCAPRQRQQREDQISEGVPPERRADWWSFYAAGSPAAGDHDSGGDGQAAVEGGPGRAVAARFFLLPCWMDWLPTWTIARTENQPSIG